jgi:hypothetical protein
MEVNIDFPVAEKMLVTTDGTEVPSHKVIVRTDTNTPLGVVGKDYALVKHSNVLRAMETKIPTELRLRSLTLCKNGAIMFAKYETPRIQPLEVKVGDLVKFGLEVFNGYDGTMKIGFAFFGERLSCMNGATVPRTISSIMQKHTGEIDHNDIAERFEERMPIFSSTVQKWQEWAQLEPSGDRVAAFFNDHLGKRLGTEMAEQYQTEQDKTVWGIFNMITHYRTHSIRVRDVQNKRLAQMKFDSLIIDAFYKHSWR